MRYKKMAKERLEECPVFRKGCVFEKCSAYERQVIQKEGSQDTVEHFCAFFNLYVKEEGQKE